MNVVGASSEHQRHDARRNRNDVTQLLELLDRVPPLAESWPRRPRVPRTGRQLEWVRPGIACGAYPLTPVAEDERPPTR